MIELFNRSDNYYTIKYVYIAYTIYQEEKYIAKQRLFI